MTPIDIMPVCLNSLNCNGLLMTPMDIMPVCLNSFNCNGRLMTPIDYYACLSEQS